MSGEKNVFKVNEKEFSAILKTGVMSAAFGRIVVKVDESV